jgi:ATP-dependent helicase HrpA
MRHEAAGAAGEHFPKHWHVRGAQLDLSYHFEPGSVRDGVTLAIPVMALNQVDPLRCEWLVPGMVREKVHLLIKSLPQKLRRACVPLPAYAQGFVDRQAAVFATPAREGDAPVQVPALVDRLIQDIRAQTSTVCRPADFKFETLPTHLLMNFKVIDDHGRQLGMGRNLSALRAEFAGQIEEGFRALTASAPTGGKAGAQTASTSASMTDWDLDALPDIQEIRRGAQSLVGFPALVDGQTHVTLEVFDDPDAAAQAHRGGLRRLFTLQLKTQLSQLEKGLKSLAPLQLKAMSLPGLRDLTPLPEQIMQAALDRICLVDPLPRDRDTFVRRREDARGKLGLISQELARLVSQIIDEALTAQRKLSAIKGGDPARTDMEQQMQRLFGKRFVADTAPDALVHYPRYFRALAARVDKLRADPQRDAMRMKDLLILQTPWTRELAARRGQADPRLEEFRWMLEELRVSLFAQELRTPYPVSIKRLEKFWHNLRQ